MRPLILALLLPLAACGKGGDGNSSDDAGGGNQASAAPLASPTGPPPKTPVMQITPAPGNEAEWMQPRPGGGDPRTAPYGSVLNQSVVDAPSKR